MSEAICAIGDCGRTVVARGFCQSHYDRWRHGLPLDTPIRRYDGRRGCSVEGCDRKHHAYGYCSPHAARLARVRPLTATVRIVGDDPARFWSYVDTSGECWTWLGAHVIGGYGSFSTGKRDNRKQVMAHRWAWEWANETPVPRGLRVLHACDNPPCVRPAHLSIGTHSDNMRDMHRKGRNPRRRSLDEE